MTLSAHCDYISDESIQAIWNISVSIQFIDSEWIPAEFTSSWSAIDVNEAFQNTIPNYWGVVIANGWPVAFSLSEYQAISGTSDDGITVVPLAFTQSNCVDLPIQSSIISSSGSTQELMSYELFKDTTLVEIWIAWFLILMYSWYIVINSVKYAISKN
jgi:hypothetical protein